MAIGRVESWDFYLVRMDGKPASFALDLQLLDGERPAKPHLICVRLPLREPRHDGLCGGREAQVINVFEDKLMGAMGEHCDAWQVGRVTTDGYREMIYYGTRPSGVDAALTEAFRGNEDLYTPHHRTEEDPDWRFFFDYIAPDERALLWMMDRRVVDQLRAHGDVAETPRPVDHYAVFPSASRRDLFLRVAASQGFDARPGDRDDAQFGAHLVRTDPVTLDHIHGVTTNLRHLAAIQGGSYDGWGAPIASADEA